MVESSVSVVLHAIKPSQKENPVVKKDAGLFLKRSKVPSILSFSTILCFYGGKLEMRRLLSCLAKGGEAFFKEKVKKGRFFRQTVCDANLIHLDEHIVAKY